MTYKLGNKTIKIPDADIKRSVEKLGITKEKAIQVWLEDEGYLENEEQEALEKKAKENRITATVHQARAVNPEKKTQKERVRKDDPRKELIIAETAKFLEKYAENIQITNIGKLISFKIGEDDYEFNLIRKRKPKKGT